VIDFRYHLVSIVAVFLALAIGIVLGSTELQGPAFSVLNSTTGKLQNELDQASSQRDAAQQQASLGEQYAQAVQPVVLSGLLAGQRLLIVTEPGASASAVAGISSAAVEAGATVTGQIALQNKFFDASATTQDSLNQVNLDMAAHAEIALQAGETYQQQAAQVIASQVLAKSTGSQTTVKQPSSGSESYAQPVLAAYAYLGFLTISEQPYTQATLAVIVTPQTAPSDGSADPLDQVLVPVAEELAAASSATVVAGTSAGSGPGSPIAVLRSNNVSNQVSTVDDADLVAGQTVVIQALAVLLNGGKAGSYGFTANGASAVAPTPAPTPAPSSSPSASASASPSATPSAGSKKKASR
jgi:Copper transport outer membrane protein, MctB